MHYSEATNEVQGALGVHYIIRQSLEAQKEWLVWVLMNCRPNGPLILPGAGSHSCLLPKGSFSVSFPEETGRHGCWRRYFSLSALPQPTFPFSRTHKVHRREDLFTSLATPCACGLLRPAREMVMYRRSRSLSEPASSRCLPEDKASCLRSGLRVCPCTAFITHAPSANHPSIFSVVQEQDSWAGDLP